MRVNEIRLEKGHDIVYALKWMKDIIEDMGVTTSILKKHMCAICFIQEVDVDMNNDYDKN